MFVEAFHEDSCCTCHNFVVGDHEDIHCTSYRIRGRVHVGKPVGTVHQGNSCKTCKAFLPCHVRKHCKCHNVHFLCRARTEAELVLCVSSVSRFAWLSWLYPGQPNPAVKPFDSEVVAVFGYLLYQNLEPRCTHQQSEAVRHHQASSTNESTAWGLAALSGIYHSIC